VGDQDGICLEYVENHWKTWKCQLEKWYKFCNTWKTTGKPGYSSWKIWNMFFSPWKYHWKNLVISGNIRWKRWNMFFNHGNTTGKTW